MEELSFYDVKTKSKFKATEYEVRQKAGRYFAVTKRSGRKIKKIGLRIFCNLSFFYNKFGTCVPWVANHPLMIDV